MSYSNQESGWNNNGQQTSGKRSANAWGQSDSNNDRMRDEREAPHNTSSHNGNNHHGSPSNYKKTRKRDQKGDVDIGIGSDSGYPLPPDGEFRSYPEIHPKTAERLQANGINNLFAIQQHCFHPIYNGEDVIGRELTGCGKTLAFSLPIIERLRATKTLGTRKIQAIVLAPTRELAIQCEKTISSLKHHPQEYDSMTVYGGVPIDIQTRKLSGGTDFFVGTTGRVLDHMERGNLDFSSMKSVILDEADQMLNMGFKEDIEKILKKIKTQCPNNIQICLFSATVPGWVRDVANEHMRSDLKYIDLAKDLSNKTAKNVKHLALDVPYHNRIDTLAQVLNCYGAQGKSIVFTSTKRDASDLAQNQSLKSIECMHGDINQHQREATLMRFRTNQLKVLVATDVASRGLDIPNVDLVVQIEPPNNTESYIHRSGRTARAGASGTCITFYNNKNEHLIDQIGEQAGIAMERISKPRPQDVQRAQQQAPAQQQNIQQQQQERYNTQHNIKPAPVQLIPPQNQTPIDIDSKSSNQSYQAQPQQVHQQMQQQQKAPQIFDAIGPLRNVRSDKLPQFEQQARKLIEMHRGDSIAALCRALAYIAETSSSSGNRSTNTSNYGGSKGHDNNGGGGNNDGSGGGAWGGRGSQGRPGGSGGGYNGGGYGSSSGAGRGQRTGGSGYGGNSSGGGAAAGGNNGGSWGNSTWGNCSNLDQEHLLPKQPYQPVIGCTQKQPVSLDCSDANPKSVKDSGARGNNGVKSLGRGSRFPTKHLKQESPSKDCSTPLKKSKLDSLLELYNAEEDLSLASTQASSPAGLKFATKISFPSEDDQTPQSCSSSVLVSNLPSDIIDQNSLTNLFESVMLKAQNAQLFAKTDDDSQTSAWDLNKCHNESSGLVTFSNCDDARLAVERCDGLVINGSPEKLIVAMTAH